MMRLLVSAAAFAMFAPAVFAGVSQTKGGVRVATPSLVATLSANRNYCPVLQGVGANGKFGILLQARIWYHGRTGNTQRFYQDQDEFSWPTRSCETTDTAAVVTTGTVDYDVRREVAIEPADPDALRLDYLLTAAETRFFDPVDFPLMYFSKEAESVSFDDGRLGVFRTAANPTRAELIRSRACLLHFPKRGKTLILLVDVNRPVDLGHALGAAIRQNVNNWSRSFNFTQLHYEEFPFFAKGTKLGVRMWFKLVDGGEFSDDQAKAVRALSAAVGARDAAFSAKALDGEYAEPSGLAARLPSRDGLSLWTETPMKRVYPGTRAPSAVASAVKLEMAANERESFQLVLNPRSAARLESVAFSDFVSADGAVISATNAYACRLGYETVADTKAVFRGETRFADRMIPVDGGADLPSGENTILHCTVFAPPGTRPGLYRANAAVVVDCGRIDVPVELRVWNVELPRETSYIGHMLVWSSPYKKREQVLRRFAECGMMGTVYNGGNAPKIKECFDGKTLRMPDDFALAEKSVKELGAPYFQVPWGFMGAWNWNTNKTVFLGLNLKLDSREFDETFENYLVELGGQLGRRGILDRSIIYMWDEMTEGHYPAMRKTTDMVRRFAPGLKVLTVSAPDPEVLANNDIIVAGHPAHWWSDEARKVAQKANRDGKKIWMYANSVTFGTASRTIIPRLTAWLCRSHGMCGYLHWSCDYNWKDNNFARNGKEWLLYPSEGEPVYSVRMEYFRDGVEDFNLMEMVKRLPEQERRRVERSIAGISSDRSVLLADPVRVAAVRRLVAEAVSANHEPATEYRLERRGDVLDAFVGGRRFAVLSPAESSRWTLTHDVGGKKFISFAFTPKPGESGTFRFPEIRLDGNTDTLKAVGSQGFTTPGDNVGSAMYLAVADPNSRRGVVAAWLTSEKGSGLVKSAVSNGVAVLRPELQFGRVGASGCERFVLGAFDDCRLGLEAYADAVAEHYAIRLKPQISGYTTWYDDKYGYSKGFGAGTPASAREFADAVERLRLKDYGFSFFQIDDFWQDGPDNMNGPAKNFTRTNPKGPFPEGMKPTADYLRSKGILPGLWYMPFSGTQKDTAWWGDKMGLFVKDRRTGAPFETVWGGTCLDMTNPDAVRYMQDVTRRICREWGYGYIKYDGMWTAMGCNMAKEKTLAGDGYNEHVFSDPSATGVDAYRRGMKALREAAGEDTFILACNLAQNVRAMGATYGLVDGCRIGGDNGPIDIFPARYMIGIKNGTPRYFLNGRVWYSDPDPVYVRDAVPLGRARMFATWASLGGMLYNFSDWLPDLSAGRVDILKRTLAPHGVKAVRPVDFFERTLANVWVLEKGDVRVFGLYNWSTNETLRIDYPAAYCGLDPEKTYVGFDFWANKLVEPFSGRFSFEVPSDSCRVIAVRECVGCPFVVSTSRHVASPAFDVVAERWDPATRTLSGRSKVVPGESYELRIFGDGRLHRASFTPSAADFGWKVCIGN